jgi:hypothetical protein
MANHNDRPQVDGLHLSREQLIQGAISEVVRISQTPPPEPLAWDHRVWVAREAIATFERTGFIQLPNYTNEHPFIIGSLQSLAHHEGTNENPFIVGSLQSLVHNEANSVGVIEISDWCMRQWLILLQRNGNDRHALRG